MRSKERKKRKRRGVCLFVALGGLVALALLVVMRGRRRGLEGELIDGQWGVAGLERTGLRLLQLKVGRRRGRG